MIETGRRTNIERDTARALAKALGCTVGWLLEGEGEPPAAVPDLDLASDDPHPSHPPTPSQKAA